MITNIYGLNRDELNRIDYIDSAIAAHDMSNLTTDDVILWGRWQAILTENESKQQESVMENRARIAEIASQNLENAANALNRLADLAEQATKVGTYE